MAKEYISAARLKEKLNSTGESIEILDSLIYDSINIVQSEYNCSSVLFANCVFENEVLIHGIDLNFGIAFINCEFKQDLSLIEVKTHGLSEGLDNNSIIIDNCQIKYFLIKNSEVERYIIIRNSTIERLFLTSIISSLGGITIDNTSINSSIEFQHNRLYAQIRFNECNILPRMQLLDNNASSIVFVKNNFKKEILIWGGNLPTGLTFNEGIYDDEVKIQYINGGDYLTFKGCTFNMNCEVLFYDSDPNNQEDKGFPKISISSSSFENGFNLIGSKNLIEPFYIDELSVQFSNKLKGNIVISLLSIRENLMLTGANFNTNLILIDIYSENVTINDLSNYSTIQFINLKTYGGFESKFSIAESYLGKSHFFDVDFSSYRSVNIRNSFLSEIITSNVKWFKYQNLNKNESFWDIIGIDKNSKEARQYHLNHFVRDKEIYRQLKVAMEKHSNKMDELMFHQLEMKLYEQQLKYSKESSYLDQAILWTNNSNEHGQNWWRPIWLSIICTTVLYCCIIISASDNYYFSITCDFNKIWSSINFLWSERGLIPQLFNPVRNLTTIFKDMNGFTLTTSTHVWDLLQRILISYFIFQTVSAFRKFNKN